MQSSKCSLLGAIGVLLCDHEDSAKNSMSLHKMKPDPSIGSLGGPRLSITWVQPLKCFFLEGVNPGEPQAMGRISLLPQPRQPLSASPHNSTKDGRTLVDLRVSRPVTTVSRPCGFCRWRSLASAATWSPSRRPSGPVARWGTARCSFT